MQDLPEYIERDEKEDDLSSKTAEHKRQTVKRQSRPVLPKVRRVELPEKELPFRVVGRKNNEQGNEKPNQNI